MSAKNNTKTVDAAENKDLNVPAQTTTETVNTFKDGEKTSVVIGEELSEDQTEKVSLVKKARGMFDRNRKLVYATAALSAAAIALKVLRSRVMEATESMDEFTDVLGEGDETTDSV